MQMENDAPKKGLLRSFPATYWVVIVMEFFERTAFYGMNAMLADYFVAYVGDTEQYGLMRNVLWIMLYLIPILSGALAEKVGYKKILAVSFIIMAGAYFGAGSFTSYPIFFLFMIILGFGGGLFKPVISSTIARCTDESNSTLGFGIYYWSINVGSCIAGLITAHFVELENAAPGEGHMYPVFVLAAVYVGLMFFNNIVFYKEPRKPDKIKTFNDTWMGIVTVVANWRFLVLLLIFSGFWGMWNRVQDSALWLLRQDYLDMTPVNNFVTSVGSIFKSDFEFTFNVAHIMVINAGVIIIFQVLVSYLVRNTRPLPTMIVGIVIASLFPLLVATSNDPWLFVIGIVFLSIGEIVAYPKLISYVGLIAPKDKVAIYMGFVFLPVFFSSFFDYPNGVAWNRLVVEGGKIQTYWYIVAGLGFFTASALFAYHVFIGKKLTFTDDNKEGEQEERKD